MNTAINTNLNEVMVINVSDLVRNSIMGILIWIMTALIIKKYYETRFEEKMFKGKKDIGFNIISGIFAGAAMALFTFYGYSVIHSVSLLILLSALLGIGKIDKKHKIIPNAILMTLLMIRIMLIAGEIFVDGSDLIVVLLSSALGVVYGTVVFLVIRLFSKESIGMGDIKLFAVIGLYIGSTAILPALFVASLLALIYGVVMIARKAISKKDTMSFGPFIAAGTIVVMVLGV